MEVQCPRCKSLCRPTAQFCSQCGSALEVQPLSQPWSEGEPVSTPIPGAGSINVNPPGSAQKNRPPNLPEQQQGNTSHQGQRDATPMPESARPLGVAFEPSSGVFLFIFLVAIFGVLGMLAGIFTEKVLRVTDFNMPTNAFLITSGIGIILSFLIARRIWRGR